MIRVRGGAEVIALFEGVDLSSPRGVIDLFQRGAEANLRATCRAGSVDVITPLKPGPERLIATGDIHDNPVALARLATLAGMSERGARPAAHLTLHEIIHSDRLNNGMDFSYRALARVAILKAEFPEHVHVLLANHELAQVVGAGITKDGVNVVQAFNDGVDYVFGDDAGVVGEAVNAFIRSMPLALRCLTGNRDSDLLCAHSLPGPLGMDRFDASVIEREIVEEDYQPRTGSAHLLVWGRNQRAVDVEALAERWGIGLFILGHEKAESGAMALHERAVILNTDHARAAYLDVRLGEPMTAEQAVARALPLVGDE